MSLITASRPPTVAVVGAGFSGLLTALHLLRAQPALHVVLIERNEAFGRGRAYSAPNPAHLLNVRASNMSAFPDAPDHFSAWLVARGHDGQFASRTLYGDYLQSLLRDAVTEASRSTRFNLEADEVTAVRRDGGRFTLRLAMGRTLEADAVVLALGAPPPAPPACAGPEVLAHPAYVADPWRLGEDDLPEGEVLLLGSGLTMVDVALTLRGRRLTALSRRGLLPRRHATVGALPPAIGDFSSPQAAVATLRALSETVGWRAAVDSIRPITADIWKRWTLKQRARFVRHAAPWWEVRRHRAAPAVAETLERLKATGRLSVVAGRLTALDVVDQGFRATIRRRGAADPDARNYAAIVNCTGPAGFSTAPPLLAALASEGEIRPDPLGLGLQVDQNLRAGERLYVVGPLAKPAVWEATAVPDLRNLAKGVAETVLADLTGSSGPKDHSTLGRAYRLAS